VKRWFRLAMLSLVLLLVALASALTAMRFAIHGGEVKVPNLVGQNPLKAETELADAGLTLDLQEHFFSQTIPEGAIVSQSPLAGTLVRRGWRVQVANSLGAPHMSVPDVIGQSGRAGQINVQRRGLQLGTVAIVHLPGLPPDQVVAESPPPGSADLISPKVNLLITAPEDEQSYVMPDSSGRTLAQAAQAITNAGLKLGNFASASADEPPRIPPELAGARITGQSPAAGQRITSGTIVSLEWPQPEPQNSSAPNPAPQH